MRINLSVGTVVFLICGWACAPMGGDEAEVMAVMDDYRTAMLTGDVDSLIDLYSEDWRDVHGSTKEDLKEGYEGTTEKGPHKGLEVHLSDIEVAIDGDVATVSPVTLSAPEGSMPPVPIRAQHPASRAKPGGSPIATSALSVR